jgi:hypothetical protein
MTEEYEAVQMEEPRWSWECPFCKNIIIEEAMPGLSDRMYECHHCEAWVHVKNPHMNESQRFFNSLNKKEQLTILECAMQGLRDEIADGHMGLDILDEKQLDSLYQSISNFMESE